MVCYICKATRRKWHKVPPQTQILQPSDTLIAEFTENYNAIIFLHIWGWPQWWQHFCRLDFHPAKQNKINIYYYSGKLYAILLLDSPKSDIKLGYSAHRHAFVTKYQNIRRYKLGIRFQHILTTQGLCPDATSYPQTADCSAVLTVTAHSCTPFNQPWRLYYCSRFHLSKSLLDSIIEQVKWEEEKCNWVKSRHTWRAHAGKWGWEEKKYKLKGQQLYVHSLGSGTDW